jgi:OPA family glycerol-3-phosphate transporter-like MFS transporter
VNAFFQSYSALSLIKVNAAWFHISERGVFSAIFGMMIQLGRFLIFALGGWIVANYEWQWVFFVPSMLVAVMFCLAYFNVRNGPEDCGLPALDVEDASSGDKGAATFGYVVRKVFTHPVTLMIAAAEFCTGLVRHGFEQWFPRYMEEAQHISLKSPIFQKNALAVVGAGILGAFAAGMLSDWIFRGRRTPVAFTGYFLQILCLTVIWQSPSLNWVVAAFVVNSFAISMVHSMLSGTASMDFGGKKAAATAAGLFDGMQYIGGSVVGIEVGWLLEKYGWGVWGPSMIGFSAIGAGIMLFLWNARPGKAK